MAIIYTYPRLSNPDGTELIVVSETKNQNATRLIALSDIAALVPSSAGGTVTSVTLDFNPLATGDTGLRLIGGITSQTITGAGTFDVGGTLFATHGGTGQSAYLTGDILYAPLAVSQTLSKLSIGAPGDILTVSAANIPSWVTPGGGAGTVTSVATTNTIGGGIGFAATPNPIIGAGSIGLTFSGAIGDIWYADSLTSVRKLPIGISTTTATGSVINQVLAVDPSGVNDVPAWTTKEILIQNAGADVETATTLIDFTGAGVTATNTGAGLVRVDIPGGGGGGVVEAEGIFTPILVTQGLNGAGTLEDLNGSLAGFSYLAQHGRYYIINKQVYIDFYISVELGIEPPAAQNTLGVSAYDVTGTTPATNVLGLQAIDALAANLNQTQTNNAGVDITEVFAFGGDPAKTGWNHAPQGGKLNKFYGDGVSSNKSVAWFHWLAQPVLGGDITANYNVTNPGTWFNPDSTPGLAKVNVIAGSLNPITIAL